MLEEETQKLRSELRLLETQTQRATDSLQTDLKHLQNSIADDKQLLLEKDEEIYELKRELARSQKRPAEEKSFNELKDRLAQSYMSTLETARQTKAAERQTQQLYHQAKSHK